MNNPKFVPTLSKDLCTILYTSLDFLLQAKNSPSWWLGSLQFEFYSISAQFNDEVSTSLNNYVLINVQVTYWMIYSTSMYNVL